MAKRRIVVGATGDDGDARRAARVLRDAGREVVFVGGDQSPQQLVLTAVAEDASELVVSVDADQLAGLRDLLATHGDDIALVLVPDVLRV